MQKPFHHSRHYEILVAVKAVQDLPGLDRKEDPCQHVLALLRDLLLQLLKVHGVRILVVCKGWETPAELGPLC